nr:FK506-binding protein 5-like isoform X1 [Megalopta genalis]XP_033327613.1 FK506-binding protein 5-like isoform X1 [Megalopta genalis]XP_033327614.1 FK506-binding protein 5-like isoform X1 [Megalopta genalis]XP_033327615.1 FK506-binding protein 5-like isoform X1 [Megalopta genalis]
MNLALHGFLLQVFLSILNLQHGSVLCSAGEPGYLDFDNLPETNFSCQGKVIGGYYADVEAGCQMFHVCTIGQKDLVSDEIMDIKFLCLNGTVFDQETRVCERVDEVDCSKSERFYNLNLELYGNNAVTLSLHENSEDDIDSLDSIDDHPQRTTSARPTTTSTTTTTSKPNKPSTTPASSTFSHPTGYPQHFQPQPPFPQVHTSQSKSLYDDKNGGYHHQYIFHNGERSNNQPATSYQLFSNQGVSSTTVQPPQVHQIRFSSTSSPQIIHNDPSTVSPLFHATSSTIQTLLSNSGNSPALINPIFHNHGIASTTEQFTLHNNNPRETSEYRESGDQSIRPLEAVQPTIKGKVSKLTISPTPSEQRSVQTSQSSQHQRISGNFLPTPATDETTIRSFYPTLRSVSKPTQPSRSNIEQVTQHIHVLPPLPIPQLKPHQITINLPPPDIQRIVQNPSPLLPSQSRVIVTAKASVSDESGRPLNTTQLVTLPLPTIPASYDDYKEGDESFDPFYRDVPKIRNARRVAISRTSLRIKRSAGETKSSMMSFVRGVDRPKRQEARTDDVKDKSKNQDEILLDNDDTNFTAFKRILTKFRDILFGEPFTEDMIQDALEASSLQVAETGEMGDNESLEDLEVKASKNFKTKDYDDSEYDSRDSKADDAEYSESEPPLKQHSKESDAEEYDDVKDNKEVSDSEESKEEDAKDEEKHDSLKKTDANGVKHVEGKRVIDVVILNPNEYPKAKSSTPKDLEEEPTTTEVPVTSTTEDTTIWPETTTKKMDSKDTVELDDEVKWPKDDSDEEAEEHSTTKPSKKVEEKKEEDEDKKKEVEEKKKEVEDKKKEDEDKKKEIEDKKKEDSNNESKAHKSKDRAEPKPNAKRKSARIRSFSGKISSRKKDPKSEEVETKVETTTMPAEEITTDEDVVSTTPMVDVDQIDKRIFDESESESSKGLDTRAVGHRGYGKGHHGGKDEGIAKHDKKGDANEYGSLKKHVESSVKDEEKDEEKEEEEDEDKGEEKTTVSSLDDEAKKPAEPESVEMNENVSMEEEEEEEEHEYKEESSIEEDDSEKVADHEKSHVAKKGSKRGKSMKFDTSKEVITHRQDKSWKFSDEDDELESQEHSTMKNEETTPHEMSSEYNDSTESFYESSHEVGTENEYKDTTDSTEVDNSEDYYTSTEDTVDDEEETAHDHEASTEGVLKYTDELPKEKKEELADSKKPTESVENTAHDYVDDNYEPDNYKEAVSAKEEKKKKKEKKKKLKDDVKNEENYEDEAEVTTSTPDPVAEKEDAKKSKEEPSTTTTTTTTVRTPPKLFKPASIRKSYTYVPPTTTPNPVVIKPRFSLLNPKPAKPPKSYNELAPKPVIRKFPLLTRKTTTTVPTTTFVEEDWPESTEVPVPMTEASVPLTEAPVTTTEARSEENVLEVKLDQDKAPGESMQKDQAPAKTEGDQDSSPSEQKSPANTEKEKGPSSHTESFTPYPVVKLSTMATTIQDTLKEIESSTEKPTPKTYTLIDLQIISTTAPPVANIPSEPEKEEATTVKVAEPEVSTESSTKAHHEDSFELTMKSHQEPMESTVKAHQDSTETSSVPESSTQSTTTTTSTTTSTTTEAVVGWFKDPEEVSTTSRYAYRKPMPPKRPDSFNCLEKEMYRFYGDTRDCRLFHYCSPGFTSRQVLDFRFVCEEGTAFDELTQSCVYDFRVEMCPNRKW